MYAKEIWLIYSDKPIHIRKLKQETQSQFVHVALMFSFIDEQKIAFKQVARTQNMQKSWHSSAKIDDYFKVD